MSYLPTAGGAAALPSRKTTAPKRNVAVRQFTRKFKESAARTTVAARPPRIKKVPPPLPEPPSKDEPLVVPEPKTQPAPKPEEKAAASISAPSTPAVGPLAPAPVPSIHVAAPSVRVSSAPIKIVSPGPSLPMPSIEPLPQLPAEEKAGIPQAYLVGGIVIGALILWRLLK